MEFTTHFGLHSQTTRLQRAPERRRTPLLCDIINKAIAESYLPLLWKKAVVTPLHKGGDREDLSNYRPISVLPVLSKVYEKHMLKYLSSYLHNNNIICTTQSGFWSNHSTTSAMHHLISQSTDTKTSSNTLACLPLSRLSQSLRLSRP